MGSVIEIRQMMAEGKLSIAQFEIEARLQVTQGEGRRELLREFLELYKLEQKNLSPRLLLEGLLTVQKETPEVLRDWLPYFERDPRFEELLEFKLLRITELERRGMLQELFEAISDYQIFCVEHRLPVTEPRLRELSEKYFRHEFSLTLQRITLALMRRETALVSKEIRELLLDLNDLRARNVTTKLQGLLEILNSFELNGTEVLFRNFCRLRLSGIVDKKDHKAFIELLIGFEDFPMLIQVVDLARSFLPASTLTHIARYLRTLPDYDFLLLEKKFPELKACFTGQSIQDDGPAENPENLLTEEDLRLEASGDVTVPTTDVFPEMEDEELNLLKQIQYGDFTYNGLFELTVSFLQSEYYRAARASIQKASEKAETPEEKLKAAYLRVTVLMKLGDFRAALDHSLLAMDLVSTEDDVLSLLYVQAECFEKLRSPKEARLILRRILEIDGSYRLARERLEKLDEA